MKIKMNELEKEIQETKEQIKKTNSNIRKQQMIKHLNKLMKSYKYCQVNIKNAGY